MILRRSLLIQFLGASCSKKQSRSGSSRRSGLQRPAGFHLCGLPCPPQKKATNRTRESFNQSTNHEMSQGLLHTHPRQILIWKWLKALRQLQPKRFPRQGKTNELRLIEIDVFIDTIFADVDTCDTFNLKVRDDISEYSFTCKILLNKNHL